MSKFIDVYKTKNRVWIRFNYTDGDTFIQTQIPLESIMRGEGLVMRKDLSKWAKTIPDGMPREEVDPNKKSLGKLAEEYDVPYSLVYAIDSRLAQDYEKPDSEPDTDTQEGVEEYWEKINYCFIGANSEQECKDSVKRILKHILTQKLQKVSREEVRKFCERGDELEQIQNELIEWFEKLGVMEEK